MRMIHLFYIIENILILKFWIVLNFHRVRVSQNVSKCFETTKTEVVLETIFWVRVQESTILIFCVCVLLCSTLCDPKYCSLPGCSVHGISQPRIQEWVPISSSRGSSRPRDWTHISCTGRQIPYHWAPGKLNHHKENQWKCSQAVWQSR